MMRRELAQFGFLRAPYAGEYGGAEEDQEKMRRLFRRVEELEDVLVESKQKAGVSRVVDYENQIAALNAELARKSEALQVLQGKMVRDEKKEMHCFDEAEAI